MRELGDDNQDDKNKKVKNSRERLINHLHETSNFIHALRYHFAFYSWLQIM